MIRHELLNEVTVLGGIPRWNVRAEPCKSTFERVVADDVGDERFDLISWNFHLCRDSLEIQLILADTFDLSTQVLRKVAKPMLLGELNRMMQVRELQQPFAPARQVRKRFSLCRVKRVAVTRVAQLRLEIERRLQYPR